LEQEQESIAFWEGIGTERKGQHLEGEFGEEGITWSRYCDGDVLGNACFGLPGSMCVESCWAGAAQAPSLSSGSEDGSDAGEGRLDGLDTERGEGAEDPAECEQEGRDCARY